MIFTYLLRLAFLVCLCVLGGLGCSESKQEVLARLSQTIAYSRHDTTKVRAVRQEIAGHIEKENREHSILLAKRDPKRIVKISMNGSTLIWLQGGQLYYLRNGKQASIDLDTDKKTFDFEPSWGGHYVVILLQEGKACMPRIISLKENKIVPTARPLPKVDCSHTPVVSDDGSTLFYAAKEKLRRLFLNNSLSAQHTSALQGDDLSPKKFSSKYKKIKSRFILYQVDPKATLVFFGNAGNYYAYYYNGESGQLKRHPQVFSSAKLYYSPNGWQGTGPVQFKMHTPKKKRLGIYNADAFAYSGGAGKRKLHALRFEDKLVVNSGFNTQVFDSLAFLKSQGEFLALRKQKFYFWDPVSNHKQRLPLSAKDHYLFSGGLAYVDLLDQLYLRQKPFSDFETALIGLYHEIVLSKS